MNRPLIELINVTKRYPGTIANDKVSMRVMPGAIHAVIGENGAGKSTLMKIIHGSVQPDEGQIIWKGREINFAPPQHMHALGIGMVFQHFALFEALSVLDNIHLSMPKEVARGETGNRAKAMAKRYGLMLRLDAVVGDLSVGERQQVEIIRCLLADPQLIIFDEPTAVLPPHAIDGLFQTIRSLAAEGRSVLYISHKLAEIKSLCHSATVLRGGQLVADVAIEDTPEQELAVLMTGRALPSYEHLPRTMGPVKLKVDRLSSEPRSHQEVQLNGVSFEVRAGEILGIAGVSGSGQQELFDHLSGERPSPRDDAVRIADTPVGRLSVLGRRQAGVAYVPEERHGHGAIPDLALDQNYLLSQFGTSTSWFNAMGLLKVESLRAAAQGCLRDFMVKAPDCSVTAGTLSGGNLQKFIVGREFSKKPEVLLVSQPTWGVDIASSMFIRRSLVEIAASGCAIVVSSEDMDELLQICDRLVVMANGRTSPVVAAGNMDPLRLGLWMAGMFDDQSEPEVEVA